MQACILLRACRTSEVEEQPLLQREGPDEDVTAVIDDAPVPGPVAKPACFRCWNHLHRKQQAWGLKVADKSRRGGRHLLYANQNFPKRVIVSSAGTHKYTRTISASSCRQEDISQVRLKRLALALYTTVCRQAASIRRRTVIYDVPRLRHKAAGLCGKRVVACARRPEGVAVEIRSECELQLQVVRRQRGQRAAQAVP